MAMVDQEILATLKYTCWPSSENEALKSIAPVDMTFSAKSVGSICAFVD